MAIVPHKKGDKMKISTIGALIVTNKTDFKCESCGRVMQISMNDDCYIYLPDGSVRFKCKHCQEEYRIDFDIRKIEKDR